jgi:ketosteroid isomerase-like protein
MLPIIRRFAFLAVCAFAPLSAQAPPAVAEVEGVIREFLTALNNLDWPAFRKCWIESPIVYHPSIPHRIDEPKAFDESWQVTFASVRKQAEAHGVMQAPFMTLQPQDLRIDVLNPEIAMATFHIGGAATVGRRTVVLVKTDGGWKMAHLHASNIPAQKAP